MAVDEKLPALRAIEVTPFANEKDELFFALHDQTRIAVRPMAVSWPGYFVLAHLDGRHSRDEVSAAFRRQFGQSIASEEIDKLVTALDEALLLQNERFERVYAAQREAYRSSPVRKSRDDGPSADELRTEIEEMLARGAPAPAVTVRGIIAPHLDYRRGGPCYADAYSALREQPPAARYVILGTNHAGPSRGVVATRKDYQTSLGRVPTDRAFVAALEDRVGESLCAHEFDQQAEHSIELQVHILQVCCEGRPFEIVPVLCPDPCGPTGTAAADGCGPDLGAFADALGALVAEADTPTIVIAGADLSHVGQRFGDPAETTPEFLAEVGERDRKLLSLLEQRKEEEFVASVRAAGNPTRVCSVGCIYTLLRALPNVPCRVLAYHQAANRELETTVTCAAAVVG